MSIIGSIRDFGAVGDGRTLDTPAVQKAIDQCADAGGGRVNVSPGVYLTGTVRLRSRVELHLEAGAVLRGSREPRHYPASTPTSGRRTSAAVLLAENLDDVAVTGLGAIDGGANEPLSLKDKDGVAFRTRLVQCRACRNVRFQDVTLRYSDAWTLHLHRCDDVTIRGLTILGHRDRINTDGIDPDGCRNVIISDCRIDTGDDCIVLKSLDGAACENIAVTNCVLRTLCTALKLGTESAGPIRNVTMNNCVIRDSFGGIGLFNKDGGTFENLLFTNLVIDSPGQLPLFIDMTPRFHSRPTVGRVRNVTFDNIACRAAGRAYIEGAAERPIENLTVRNLTWDVPGPCEIAGLRKQTATTHTELDPAAENYAEQPYHFVVINVRGARFSGIRVNDVRQPPAADRGLFHLRRVSDSLIEDVTAPPCPPGLEPIAMRDCDGVIVRPR